MSETVAVTIEVEAAAAAAMADTRTRAAIGRLVSRVLNPQPGPSQLAQAIAAAKAEARGGKISAFNLVRPQGRSPKLLSHY